MNGFNNLKKIIHKHKDIKMKVQIKLQKLNMQLALNWLNIIEICDHNISIGFETTFYKEKRDTAVKAYADVMTSIVKDAIELSNINLENIAA
jgi:hypothetical protein